MKYEEVEEIYKTKGLEATVNHMGIEYKNLCETCNHKDCPILSTPGSVSKCKLYNGKAYMRYDDFVKACKKSDTIFEIGLFIGGILAFAAVSIIMYILK